MENRQERQRIGEGVFLKVRNGSSSNSVSNVCTLVYNQFELHISVSVC